MKLKDARARLEALGWVLALNVKDATGTRRNYRARRGDEVFYCDSLAELGQFVEDQEQALTERRRMHHWPGAIGA